jgi:zinc protease
MIDRPARGAPSRAAATTTRTSFGGAAAPDPRLLHNLAPIRAVDPDSVGGPALGAAPAAILGLVLAVIVAVVPALVPAGAAVRSAATESAAGTAPAGASEAAAVAAPIGSSHTTAPAPAPAPAPALAPAPATATAPTQAGVPASSSFFPYPVHKKTLPNGLDVIVLPMHEFKDVLSYNTMVLVGSRNEVEQGKSGLAHLFEHILFRHRWEGKEGGYDAAVNRMGAFNNASTGSDITYYQPLTFTSNLDLLARLEADRFGRLAITEKIFQTEAGAVLGEYRRLASDPSLRMEEVHSQVMYGSYGYGHTAIGYLVDVEDMPNEYKAAVRFYDDYYRPNNCVLIVAGDVDPARIFALAEQLYAGWQQKPIPALGDPAPLGGPKQQEVPWPVDVPPRVEFCYRMPAHHTGSKDTAIGQILPELLTSETAPLYQLMRYKKQTATGLFTPKELYQSFGPGPFVLTAILYQDKYAAQGKALLSEASADMIAALQDMKSFSARADAAQTLQELGSKYAYDLLSGINSPAHAAEIFGEFYRFERDPQVFDKLVGSVRSLTPQDIDAFAKKIFVPENQTVVTLIPGAAAAAAAGTQ